MKKILKIIKVIIAILRLFYHRIAQRSNPGAVAQVVSSFNAGGLEQVALNIYKGFSSEQNGSYIISVCNHIGPIASQVESPAHLRIVYNNISEFINFCARKNIKTLIFHHTRFGLKIFKMLGFKNYYIVHNTYLWYSKNDWKKLRFDMKFVDGVVSVSDWTKKYFANKTGISKIKVILNGINFDNLFNSDNTEYSRKKLKIKDKDIVFLMIGAYTEGKNQMTLIGAMEEILKNRNNIKFVCAGHILNNDYYNEFMKKLSKSASKEHIIPLTYISQREMGSFIKKIADAYFQPSIHEAGVPLSVMEAFVLGLPVIITDFSVDKSMGDVKGVFKIPPPYDDINEITPIQASQLSKKIKNTSTRELVKQILYVSDNLSKIKEDMLNNSIKFLSIKRMQKEYFDYINKCDE